jgi:rRNA maturation endonuclease Nob1|tara:strand:- start:411 stop:572 length:162 start_codon:yes stop_codon:yes gene_type:complete
MERFEHICGVCDTEFAVELFEEKVAFCPCCGEHLAIPEDETWEDDNDSDEDDE